jgi:hypothetical protein
MTGAARYASPGPVIAPPTNLWRGFLWHIAGGMRTWMRPADRGIDQPTSEAPPKTSNGRGFRNRSR